MKNEESDNLNNVELFTEIKEKCKSNARTDIFGHLLVLLILIATIIFFHDSHEVNDIIFFIASVVFLGITIWLTLFSYRFYKRIAIIPTATAVHTISACRRACRIHLSISIIPIPIVNPFTDITTHIIDT